ncbi:ISNCY family transposase [Candidatus Woesearchaeota archaeon]|nr:ISNCY family transposase [Candidatus Woesearchaeota archaeon]
MNEDYKYNIIKKLVESNGNKDTAALKLNCTRRTINRLIIGYKTEGKLFFQHGNRDRKPKHTTSTTIKNNILDLYKTKYFGANFVHFSELLMRNENIKISPSTINSILLENNILSPKATKASKKKLRISLEEKMKQTTSKKDIAKMQSNLISIEDAHPRRPRCSYFGEMLQMDASVHHWFGTTKTQLHVAIDDSSGAIVGAYFDSQETLKGYYNVLDQILNNYGIPYMFYTDRRTVFEYKQKKSPSLEEDTFTQFGYACKQLGIDIKTTSCAQAKGRVERLFQTLQSRLPIELRLAGIATIKDANVFLNSYIKEYNEKFSIPVNNIKSVFEKQPSKKEINLTLAILAERKIDNGHCIKFEKKFYMPTDEAGHAVYYHKGTNCVVIKAFDGKIYTNIQDKVYMLDVIPEHEHSSRNFEFKQTKIKTKSRSIPKLKHPWRQINFQKFIKSQKHRYELDFQDVINTQEILQYNT